jgi:hypothetical protein
MMDRCLSPGSNTYRNYGGRGISVCPQWRDFRGFLADMGERPSRGHSLDRIDNEKGYEPGNCRWATAKQQGRNKRNSRLIEAFGRVQTLSAWAEEIGQLPSFISRRLELGWDVERALSAPKVDWRKIVTAFGRTRPLVEWAKDAGLEPQMIHQRLARGWDAERALGPIVRRGPG